MVCADQPVGWGVEASGRPSTDSSPEALLNVVTHHKSGTVAMMSVVAALCFDEGLDELATRKLWDRSTSEVEGSPFMNFWYLWNHVYGWPADGDAAHAGRCRLNRVRLHPDGLQDAQPPARLLLPAEANPQKQRWLHFAREPTEMLLSGYLYHRQCREPQWTNHSRRAPGLFPRRFPVQGSYCAWLQRASTREGLEMEMRRTLYAESGLGLMLSNAAALREAGRSGALTLCCCDYASQLDALAAFVAPWNRCNRSLRLHEVRSHRSSATSKALLRDAAREVVDRFLGRRLLLSLQCAAPDGEAESSSAKEITEH